MIIEKLSTGKVRIYGSGVKQRNLSPAYDVIEDLEDDFVIIREGTNTTIERFKYTDVDQLIRDNGGTVINNPDLPTLLEELSTNFFFDSVGSGGGFNFTYLGNNFTDLNTVATQPIDAGTIAYVFNSEGTQWLPSTIGGSYYPAGIYVSDGSDWVSDRNSIANQLQINVDDIDQLQADLLQEVIDRTNADAVLQLQINNHVNNALIHQEVIQRIEGGRGAANTSNQYLRSDDRVPMNLNGQRLNYNTTLVSLMVSTNGSETWDAEVRKNGVVTPVYTESITASDYEISVPNIDFDADDEVQFYCNGTGINRPKMIGIFQRR